MELVEQQICSRQYDRRQKKLQSVLFSLFKNRRHKPRRSEELEQPYYTDQYDLDALLLVLGIITLCVVDAAFTLVILAHGGVEVNPVMAKFLEYGSHVFFLGKFSMTAAGVLFLLVHINFKLLNFIQTRHLLLMVFLFYVGLIGYELTLLPTF